MGDVVMFLDTQNQNTWVGQLSVLQTLRGFPIPGKDADDKWKKYVGKNNYEWCSAKSITVVMPWFRPCQQERSSRWVVCNDQKGSDGNDGICAKKQCTECGEKEKKNECTATSCLETFDAFKKGGKCHLQNSCDSGKYIDVPTAQTMLRLINAPQPTPGDMGPSSSGNDVSYCDGKLPPGHLKVLVVEAHEEGPINALHREEKVGSQSVLYLGHLLKEDFSDSIAKQKLNILFPDMGALHRYTEEAKGKGVDP